MPHSIELVREFHHVFGHPVEHTPTPSTAAHRRLRVALIAEELGELCQALGVAIQLTVTSVPTMPDNGKEGIANGMLASLYIAEVDEIHAEHAVNLVEAADALGDLDYVVQGSNLVFGFPAERVLAEIHDSNMSKLGDDGNPIRNEMGKIVKGPRYRKPDITRILQEEL